MERKGEGKREKKRKEKSKGEGIEARKASKLSKQARPAFQPWEKDQPTINWRSLLGLASKSSERKN